MKQTPIHDQFNADVLAVMPANAVRVVEVGCSSGALAREYLRTNPQTDYIGIEVDPEYAAVACTRCSKVIVANIETMDDTVWTTLFPSDCWIFGDVLEHLYDPWAVLRCLRVSLAPGASVVACIPNSQHWSIQARLNSGLLRYEESGLLDRTHIRWFTKRTIFELFESSRFKLIDIRGRVFPEPQRDRALAGVRALAQAIGANAEAAVSDATPVQWVVRAFPN